MGSKTAAWIARIAALSAIAACLPDLGDLPPDTSGGGTKPCGDGALGPGEECDPGDHQVKGCVDCKITCEGTRDAVTGHCYFEARSHRGGPPGFTQALSTCIDENAHLLTVGSDSERDMADRIANGRPYWIGLQFIDNYGAFVPDVLDVRGVETGWPQPHCTGPCTGCYGFGLDGGGLAYADGGVPDLGDGGDKSCRPSDTCVVAIASRRWVQVFCEGPETEPPVTICEREPPGDPTQFCGSLACFSIPGSKKVYSVHVEQVTQENALCEEGTHLVVFDDDVERMEFVRALSKIQQVSFQETDWWIGLVNDGTSWVWEDAGPRDVRIWGDREPAANVGRARLHLTPGYASGLARASTGSETAGFFCERDP